MPATLEGLLILLVFVMPGFITVRTREALVPSVGKPDALQITLRSITVSILYLPLWLLALPDLLVLRARLAATIQTPAAVVSLGERGVLVFFVLALILPIATGIVWAIGYWNDWYATCARRIYPKLGLRPPGTGVGEDLWDKLWLNLERQIWLAPPTQRPRSGLNVSGRASD
jgi:hypothetical protein